MAVILSSRVSSKGQVVIPKDLRDAKHWTEGTELIFVSTPQGVLMKPKSPFPETNIETYLANKKPYGVKWIPEEEWGDRIAESLRDEWIKK